MNNKENTSSTLSSSELDSLNDNCITNLKILANVKIGNKICYDKTSKKFSIDEWSYSQCISRWWNEEGRKVTIKSLEEFINNVFTAIDTIYNSEIREPYDDVKNTYYAEIASTRYVFKEHNSTLLLQFINEMHNAVNGLNNLKQTYKDDIATVSSLEIIVEKINVRIKKIQGILQVNTNKPSRKNDNFQTSV